MLSKKMEDALNTQINAEFYSSYLYLSMAAYLNEANLVGFAHWMEIQAQEEAAHAMMFYIYMKDRGAKITLGAIDKPDSSWKSPLDVMAAVLKHELKVTGLINNLVDLALKERDHATNNHLQWFVKEQVEEEANATAILQQLKLIGGKGEGLLMLDRELKARVFVNPMTPGA
ncbi:MAG: ferritin [Bacteroidota bacterium]